MQLQKTRQMRRHFPLKLKDQAEQRCISNSEFLAFQPIVLPSPFASLLEVYYNDVFLTWFSKKRGICGCVAWPSVSLLFSLKHILNLLNNFSQFGRRLKVSDIQISAYFIKSSSQNKSKTQHIAAQPWPARQLAHRVTRRHGLTQTSRGVTGRRQT